jgi:diguanylate cyclase (GGDEF)-like protein/PAS domain S-box-containing protein
MPLFSTSYPQRLFVGPGTSAGLARASLVKFSAILALVFALAAGFLWYLGADLDRDEQAQARSLVEKSLRAVQKSVQLTLKDYAFWGEAYTHLHTRVDVDWAYARENFGPTLYHDFGLQGLFVIGPNDRTVYSVIDGKYETVAAQEWAGQPLDALVRDARAAMAEERVVSYLTLVHGMPTLLAGAAITTGTDTPVNVDERPPSVMVVGSVLDQAKLDEIGGNLAIKGLRVARSADTQAPSITLVGERGEMVTLQWDPVRPGRQMLMLILPLIALAGIAIGLMTWMLLRRDSWAAHALDATHAQLRRSQSALAASELRFRDVAEASSDWIWEVDDEGRVSYLSERFEQVTGIPTSDWLGSRLDDLLQVERGAMLAWLRRAEGPLNGTLECRYSDASGRPRVARFAARSGDRSGFERAGFRGTATDITAEIEARLRVEYLSRHDVLTGLPNRHYLREFLEGKLDGAASSGPSLVMLTIDLDRFKPVNDLLGHASGDQVLHEVARRMSETVRQEDILARVGGDEFVMVLGNAPEHHDVEALCQRLIDSIERVFVVDGQDIFISASIGIALSPEDASQVAELLRYSDIALYEAKASGRGTWRFYAGDMNDKIIERRRLESDLRYAIRHDELRLQFQPRFRLKDNHMVGAEALVRWQHPQRGMLGPDAFVPIAEETGLVTALGDWVLNAACVQARRWPEGLFVSVNVSSKEFQLGHLVERVEQALARSGLAVERLELELTESVMLEDGENALGVMQRLKALGVRLSMDDFGTGYSSLSYLRSFPFDGLKIDRSFVERLGQSPADLAVIEAVIGLGRALSLTVTAEGIETLEQLELLDSVACDEGQGYYLCRPLGINEFEAFANAGAHGASTGQSLQ